MSEEDSWRVIAEQRLALADLLDGLTPEQWSTATVCEGWRVRDVAAHVALASQPLGWSLLRGAARARGSFDRLNRDVALRAFESPAEIVTVLRRDAFSRRLPFVTNYRNIVPDILVHGQDIALPLSLDHRMPPAAARRGRRARLDDGLAVPCSAALGGPAPGRTDVSWSAGAGRAVTGPIDALLLLLTGRVSAAAPRLEGPGVGRLTIKPSG